jgi:hypothetical protein
VKPRPVQVLVWSVTWWFIDNNNNTNLTFHI